MRIILITTNPNLDENGRIAKEVKALGYEFKLFNFREFEYRIVGGKLIIDGFSVKKGDIVIPRAIFRSVNPLCAFIKSLRVKGVKVFDNNFLKHKFSINKLSDLIKLNQAGIPIPDSYHVHSFDKYFEAAKKLGYPLVLKLTRTGKGAGVHKVDNEVQLRDFIRGMQEKGIEAKSYLIQKYISYKLDLRVLIIGDQIFCMQRIPAAGEFRANFSLGGSVKVYNLDKKGKEMSLKAMKAVDLEVAGVDMLITRENRRFILEVNHTPGMLGMERATGENITRVYLEYAIKNAR